MSAESLADLLARQMPAGVATRAQGLLRLQAALDRALPAALAGLAQLQIGIEDGPLKDALANLLRHHRKT